MANVVEVVVGADITGLRKQFAVASAEVKQFGTGVKNAFAGIRDAMGNIGNLMGGFAAVKLIQVADEAALLSARLKDVTGSAKLASEAQGQLFNIAQRLQVGFADLTGSFARMMPAVRELGGGVNEASRLAEILATTARLSGASSAEAAASAIQFAQALGSGVLQGDELRSILENNQALARTLADALGVSVGELKKLGSEGKLTSDVVANALLGKYDEIARRSAELPNTVGGAWTRVTNEFQKFVGSVNDGTSVFSVLADVLNELARFLGAVSVSFSTTSAEAKKLGTDTSVVNWGRTIMETFAGIIDLARLVKQAFVSVGKDIGAVAAAIVQAVQGNFSTAAGILKQRSQDLAAESKVMADLWKGTGNSMLGTMRAQPEARAGGPATVGKLNKAKTGEDDSKKKKAKEAADPSFMSYYEGALDEAKRVASEEDALREYSKQKELAYWRNILQYAQLSASDRLAVSRKVADLEVAIRRDGALQARALADEERAGSLQLALGAVEVRRAANKLALDSEKITRQQYVAGEMEMQAQIFQIQSAALKERMQLALKDPNSTPAERARINNELLQLEQQFQINRTQIVSQLYQKQDQQNAALFNGMANSFSTSLETMMLQAKTFQDAMRTLWNGLATVFIRVLITEPLGQWIAMQAKMLAAKLGFGTASAAADTATSTATVAAKTAEASAVIGAEGAKAGAGAAASQAAIPIVGPGLAIAAMVATLAAVLALRSGLKSAAGGYDIGKGVNPMVQLHEEEMVLPKNLARGVRSMVAGGEQGGGQQGRGAVNLHVSAMDAKSFETFLGRNANKLVKTLGQQQRNFRA
jgi:tape measure domain-containing protein